MIHFVIHGEPRGKGRGRATTIGGHARVFTDAKTRKYELHVAAAAADAMRGQPPLECALKVSIRVRFSIPPSYSKKKRARILAGEEAYFGPFDVDNHAKAVLDGINGLCFADDKQVVYLAAIKQPSEVPGVDVWISPYTRGNDGGQINTSSASRDTRAVGQTGGRSGLDEGGEENAR